MRISSAGMRSQRPWGGNVGGQEGAGGLVGHRQPADPLAGGQGDLLDGVDLPDLVGQGRPGGHDDGRTAPAGPVDPGADEGELEAPDGGERAALGVRAELQPDQSGTPGGVVPLQLASDAEEIDGARGDRAAQAAVIRHQAVGAVAAEEPPDVAGGAVGDRQLGRDPGQGDALLVTAHDLLTEGDREGARHGGRLRGPATDGHRFTRSDLIHAYSQRHDFLRIVWCKPYCA